MHDNNQAYVCVCVCLLELGFLVVGMLLIYVAKQIPNTCSRLSVNPMSLPFHILLEYSYAINHSASIGVTFWIRATDVDYPTFMMNPEAHD